MKKITLFLTLFALLTACAQQNAYDLRGKLTDEAWNGQWVHLYGLSEMNGLISLDSTRVEKNSFHLKGKVDTAGWYILMIQNPSAAPIYKDFYIGGKLECTVLKDRIQITGSKVNDQYQKFEDQYYSMSTALIGLNQQMKANPQDESLKASFKAAYEEFAKSYRILAKKTILDNMDNPMGVHVFEASLSSLENADLDSILAEASPKFLSNEIVKMVASQLELSRKVAEGAKCPDLTMSSPEGTSISLSQYIGKENFVLIDFWASWCAPCMRELPNVLDCYKTYHVKGFEVVGVSLDEDAAAWKAAINKNKIPWPQMSDLAGWKSEAVSLFSFSGIPHTVLVNPEGIIVAKNLRGDELKNKLKEIYGR
jgi:peroxiredoxin